MKKLHGIAYWAAISTFGLVLPASAAPVSWNASFVNDVGLSAADFAKFQASINTALNFYTSTYVAPNALTVNVEFRAGSTGLGTTTITYTGVGYQEYRNALAATGTSADDATALGFLPNIIANPVNGNQDMLLPLPLLRALGFAQGNNPGLDASVVLNVGSMTLDRADPQAPGTYDLIQVTYHELNEVLGWTSALNGVPNNPVISPTGVIQAADLFRYRASGVRSFTSDPSEAAYLSINGGVTGLANFNTDDGGDRQDFNGLPAPSVQDAFSTADIRLDNGLAERTFLDVIGYNFNVAPVPEPGAITLFAVGGLVCIITRRRWTRR